MSKRKVKVLAVIFFIGLVMRLVIPVVSARGSNHPQEAMVVQQVRALTPLSIQMVDQALATLSGGWSGMSPAEQEAFLNLYDPANAGGIDARFLQNVSGNYQRIRSALEKDIEITYEPDSDRCEGQRLYYTDLISLHVCPYFLAEPDEARKARTLIHEFAHIALRVTDRPYYRPTSKSYAELTPRGSWANQLPLVGPVIREILGSDTLYHPDTYAHFAVAASGQAGALEKYLDQGSGHTSVSYGANQPEGEATFQTVDSWSLGS